MNRGVKVRLIAFAVLSAVGLLYLGGSYLGLVDRIAGKGYDVTVRLPSSGGLFEGSEVTYRGVKVGRVEQMKVHQDGLELTLRMQDGTRIPRDSPVYVHNLSAVGEQYLDFEPASKGGPVLEDGDVVTGTPDSLPVGEDVLVTNLNRLVSSLDADSLNTVVTELGTMFRDNAEPLRSLVDNGQLFIQAATEHEDATTSLINSARTLLQTQADQGDNIRSFSRDLSLLLSTVETSDDDLRTILTDAGPATDEATALVSMLRAKLPSALRPLVSVNDVLNARLPALEQLLVTFPRLVAAGPSALADRYGDKLGRVNLNLNEVPGACTDGYLPPEQWRLPEEESFVPYYPAQCASGAPINMRGMKYAPDPIDWRSVYLGDKQ